MMTLPVVGLLALCLSGRLPRGVPGEWEWGVPHGAPESSGLALACLAVAVHVMFAWAGHRSIAGSGSGAAWLLRSAWLAGLVPAGVAAQVGLMAAAPPGYGLAKWATLGLAGSSGYFTTADREIDDPMRFWSEYATWIQGQDTLHIGTHPPGLLLSCHATAGLMERNPALVRMVDRLTPEAVAGAMRVILGPDVTRTRLAALAAFGMLTMLLAVLAAVPVYGLARAMGVGPGGAWGAAVMWPLVPSLVLFHPTADTVYPLLSASALALALGAGSSRGRRGLVSAVLAGVVLGIGMQYTLAFGPVGLIVGLAILLDRREGARWRDRSRSILGVGAGFAVVTGLVWLATGANPLVIWWFNARNHHLFYDEYPRRLLAWAVANPIETAVGLGWPIVVLGVLGLRRSAPALATVAMLAALTLSGRNLGEVGRLWMVFFPPLVAAAGAGLDRLERPRAWIVVALVLLSVEILALQGSIQVVYPV